MKDIEVLMMDGCTNSEEENIYKKERRYLTISKKILILT